MIALTAADWFLPATAIGRGVFMVVEIEKAVARWRMPRQGPTACVITRLLGHHGSDSSRRRELNYLKASPRQ